MSKKTNIPKAFIGFLIASFLMWALINLSKEYTSVVSYVVDYDELPQNKLLEEKPQENIDLLIKASGFKLLSANIASKKVKLKTNSLHKKSNNNYYFLPKNQQLELQKQLASGLKIEEVLQDTICLKIGILATKKLPVKNTISMQFEAGYNLSETLKIEPSFIEVSGPKSALENLKEIETVSIPLENINTDFTREVDLKLPESSENIRFSNKKVKLVGKVDKFTEGSFDLPFTVENLPVDVEINTFPKTIKVTYKVGLKNFNKVTANSFSVVCDFKQAQENELNYLIPKIKSKPEIVSSVKIEPNKIEYLIHK